LRYFQIEIIKELKSGSKQAFILHTLARNNYDALLSVGELLKDSPTIQKLTINVELEELII